jgi:hypothetical protein
LIVLRNNILDAREVAEDNATYTRYKNNINFAVINGINQSHGEKAFDYNTKQYKALVSKRPTYKSA